jgi:hypothetical protein
MHGSGGVFPGDDYCPIDENGDQASKSKGHKKECRCEPPVLGGEAIFLTAMEIASGWEKHPAYATTHYSLNS